jgi:hypothetical protein
VTMTKPGLESCLLVSCNNARCQISALLQLSYFRISNNYVMGS